MKQIILSFFLIFSLICFQNALAQEEVGDVEQSYTNPSFTQGAPQSIFEDGQQLFGSNWEWMHPTPSGSSLYWVQVLDANTWFMAGAGGTFQKTTDGGATWTVYKDIGGLSATGFYRTIYDGHFFDANTGILCGSSGTLIRTTDGGATWDSVGVGVSASIYDIFFLNTTVGFISGTTSIDVWKTTDAGLTWTSTGGAVPASGYSIWAIDEDTLLVATTSGNVRRSTDGGATWATVYIGITETLQDIEMSSATDGWVTGNDGAASYTTDAGASWTLANTGLGTVPDYNDVDIKTTTTTQALNEGFEDVTFPPTGWHTKDLLGTNSWYRYTSLYHTGVASARISYQSTGGEDWLVTPQLPVTAGDSLKFWARRYYTSTYEPDTLQVLVSTTDTAVTSFTNVIYQSSVNLFGTTDWTNVIVDLSTYAGGNIYIAFRHYDTDGNGCLIDDVTIGEAGVVDVVYATGDAFDIYYTTDMGTSWNPFSHLDPSQAWTGEFFSTDFISGTDAITVGTRGMMNTWAPPLDAGTALNTWVKSGTLYDIWAYSASGNVIAVGKPGISGTTFDQVIYSIDGGDNWAIGTFNQPTGQDLNDLSMVDSLLGYACGDEGSIYKTTDGGVTWDSVSTPSVLELEEVFFLDDLLGYTFGDDDEAYKTTDGGATWSSMTIGFGTADIMAAYFTDANTGWVVGSSGNIYKTTDGGTTWNSQTSGVTTTLRSIHMINDNVGYLCGSSSVVRKTTDGGTTWDALTVQYSTTLYDIEFTDANNGIIVASSGRTFITGDGGATWNFENNSSSTLYGVGIQKMSVDTLAAYTCGSLSFIMRNAHVLVPVELASFTASVTGNNVTLSWMTATELNNLGFQVERKSEEQSWIEVGFVDGHGTTIEPQIYTFTDAGLPSGIYNYRIKQMDFDGSYKYYQLEQEVEIGIPESYNLSQNYPNPFNPTTKIKYSVPADGFVNIAVYNVLGEKVTEIVNGLQKAGSYEVTFDATNFASGMYIYRMESGDFASVKKMMILK